MPRRDRPYIPFELHQIKAQQIYEKRVALGIDGTPEDDWEKARIELEEKFWEIRDWRIQKAIEKKLQQFRSVCRRLWQSFKALIDGIWKLLTLPFWLLTKLPQQFANTDTRPFALDVVKTVISAASLIAAVIAAIGLFFSYQDSIQDRRLTQERLITDRFTKAVEQIGKKDQEEVVIGGIYSLERIAKDSPKDQWTIMEVLTAFVRKNSPIPAEIQELDDKPEDKIKALEQLKPVTIQVQAALTVIGRRNPDQDNTQEDEEYKSIDLSNSNLLNANLGGTELGGANFGGANLVRADLRAANLALANLVRANLGGADLVRANLGGANLRGANLGGADLLNARLVRANLGDATLRGANLEDATLFHANLVRADLRAAYLALANLVRADLRAADLRAAYLVHADLEDAYLGDANLGAANLGGADLEDANLEDANLGAANLGGADLALASLFRANLRAANLRAANLRAANLVGVKNLSKTQIKSACFWEAAYYNQDRQAHVQKIEEIRQDKASDPTNPPDCSTWEL